MSSSLETMPQFAEHVIPDEAAYLAWIFHGSPAATTDMDVLPGVLGCRPLRRTVQVRLGTNTLRLPGGTPIFAVSRQQFMKYPGYAGEIRNPVKVANCDTAPRGEKKVFAELGA